MATYTTNYNLKKPADADSYDIADANGNMDIIDGALGTLNNQMANKANNSIVQIDTEAKTTYTFNAPKTSGSYEVGLLYGATAATQTFLYFVFVSSDGSNVSIVPIIDNGTRRTFTGSWSNNTLTINVSVNCWGGLRLIWAHR